ncbi:probable 28S ribosomal protein S16, mitochondrial [Microplitis demolitor]|uniref:probable 28S ribosomal protein S16, mitochondrial n=1 Tax=Microplitis demolitor TaxID=69319 RepID=UPI0004CDDBFA|nr:probable 28S ribosomal protein S16, mitochondrial [Microplitis demolitor]XP_008559301.1 probable 28S ribosomal protein S16, mitochondrial [Microplitis demolitor]
MPRYPLHPSSGTGVYSELQKKVIRLARYGCANRPFFHIVVMPTKLDQHEPPIEQLGTFDPMVNQYNEKLVSFNFERIQFWLGQGNVEISKVVEELLGLSGFLPISPSTYNISWRNRMKAEKEAEAKLNENKQDSQKAEQSN